MEGSRIVVTGGAGFLGSHVVQRLLREGHHVTVLDDFSNGKWMHLDAVRDHPSLQVVEGDVTAQATVARVFAGADVVIHLAVLGLRQSIREPRRVNEVIVDGTLNCLDAARDNGVRLFLNCSSSEVYGTASYVPMDERHPLNPETPYAAAKVAQDKYVESYGRTYGLPWLTVRPFNMYGPNSHWQGYRGELIPKMIVRAMNREPLVLFGDGAQTRDFLYVEDAARALTELLECADARGHVVNVCSGRETSVRAIAEGICTLLDLDPDAAITTAPSRPGDVARHCGDDTLLRSLTADAARVPLDDGLRTTVEWFRSLPLSPQELLSQEILRAWE